MGDLQMARTAKKSTAKNKKPKSVSKKSNNLSNFLGKNKMWVFALLFGVLGTGFLLFAGAEPKLPTYSDDIVVGYLDLKPTVISKDENGNIAYEMYPASTYVQADGTVVCDPGSSDPTNVKTGTISQKEVEKLYKDILKTDVTSLADEITAGDEGTEGLVQFEGFLVGEAEEAKGTAVYAGAQKPAKFEKAQKKLQAVCEKATKSVTRELLKAPREPKLKKTNKNLMTIVDDFLVPSASACCNTGTSDFALGAKHRDDINNYRASKGKRTLAPTNKCMTDNAYAWTHKMANSGEISHDPGLRNVADYCYGSTFRGAGENVGRGYDYSSLFQAFKNSSGHNANMLNSAWDESGVGAVRNPDGQIFITQRYIDRR